MIIRCYGARGSIPVSGDKYLKYGGDTTCLEIRSKDDEIIIIDAGSGIRRLGNRLLREQRFRYNIIFTHSHWDHILGFPFFKPIYNDKVIIDLMGCTTTQGNLQKLLSKAMSQPFFPYPFDHLKAKINYSSDCPISFNIGSVEITESTEEIVQLKLKDHSSIKDLIKKGIKSSGSFCSFEAGLLAGIVEKLSDRHCFAQEIGCSLQTGENYCEFMIVFQKD